MVERMGNNRMNDIAKLFGKDLEEEFSVKSRFSQANCIGCFTKYGFEGRNLTIEENNDVFLFLCTGKAVIVDEA